MDNATAQQVDRLARHAQGYLNEALLIARAGCTPEEFEALRSTIGNIMGSIVIDLLQPLYAKHPDIVPPEIR